MRRLAALLRHVLTSKFEADFSAACKLEFSTMSCSFVDYLKTSKRSLALAEEEPQLHVVIGNESCDLDSMVSAMSLAYYHRRTTYADGSRNVVAVMNLDSEDMALRTENVHLLEKYGLSATDLIYKNDLDLHKLHEDNMLVLSLVDHHELTTDLRELRGLVTEIYDHRPLDATADWSHADVTIEQVGSCATLIADLLLQVEDVDVVPLSMLYETIVFDTVAFNKDVDKAKELDFKVCERLRRRTSNADDDVKKVFDELWSAHNDVARLTSYQLLRKDLKIVDGVHVPGLPMLVVDFLRRNDAATAVKEYCRRNEAKALLLMGLEGAGETVKRDLAIYNDSGCLSTVITRELVDSPMGLTKVDIDGPFAYYRQGNVKMSRKQVVPIIKGCVEKLSSP